MVKVKSSLSIRKFDPVHNFLKISYQWLDLGEGGVWPFAMVLQVSVQPFWHAGHSGEPPPHGGAYPTQPHPWSRSQFLTSEPDPKAWGISRMWNMNFSEVSSPWCFIPLAHKFPSNPVRKVLLSLFYLRGRALLEWLCLFKGPIVIKREQQLGQTGPLRSSVGLPCNAHPLWWLKTKLSQNKYCFPI